jgi:hypothetical protein
VLLRKRGVACCRALSWQKCQIPNKKGHRTEREALSTVALVNSSVQRNYYLAPPTVKSFVAIAHRCKCSEPLRSARKTARAGTTTKNGYADANNDSSGFRSIPYSQPDSPRDATARGESGWRHDENGYPPETATNGQGRRRAAAWYDEDQQPARMKPQFFLPPTHPLAVVLFAFQHRFVTAAQVQRAFNLNSYRTAQHRLTQLVRQRWLADVPVYRTLNSFPHVYIATGRGVNRLRRAFEEATGRRWPFGGAEQRRRGRPRRLTFIEHELDITDVNIRMLQLAACRADMSLLHIERRYDRRGRGLSFRDDQGEQRRFTPDAGYYARRWRSGRRWLDLLLLEMDRGHMAWGTRMVEKFASYDAWATSDSGRRYLLDHQRVLGDPYAAVGTFRLLVIARTRPGEGSDTDRLVKLVMASLQQSNAMRRRLWLTTWTAFAGESEPGSAPIWWWGKDLAAWREAYNALDESLPHDVSGDRDRRAFVAEQIAKQSKRSLFKGLPTPACYTERPHEREYYEPDNSILLPSWDREGIGAYAGV